MKKREVFLLVAIFALDQLTKFMISGNMTLNQSITIIPGFFYITYIHNSGAAWGLFQGAMPLFYVMTAVGIAFLGYLLYQSKKTETLQRISFVLMIAGALGNFYDRLVNQYVVDFLNFYIFGYDFPVFNVADMALCIGVFLLAVSIFWEDRQKKVK